MRWARCSTSRIATPPSRISASASKTLSTSDGARPSDGSSRSSTSGCGDQRARDRELLLLAAGEQPRLPLPELAQHREELVGAVERAPRDPAAARREAELEVLLDA